MLLPFVVATILTFWLGFANRLHELQNLERGPVPIQKEKEYTLFDTDGNIDMNDYVYMDVKDVSDWVAIMPEKRSTPRTYYYYEMIDVNGQAYIVRTTYRLSNRKIFELRQGETRIVGITHAMLKDEAEAIVSEISEFQSVDEIRLKYGYDLLILDGEPFPDDPTAFLVGSLAVAVIVLFRFILTGDFSASIRTLEKRGSIEELLADWKIASPYFKKADIYLGKKYLFKRMGCTFFSYRDICDISYKPITRPTNNPNVKIRDALLVVWLKDGRKINLGEHTWQNWESYAYHRALLFDYLIWKKQQ